MKFIRSGMRKLAAQYQPKAHHTSLGLEEGVVVKQSPLGDFKGQRGSRFSLESFGHHSILALVYAYFCFWFVLAECYRSFWRRTTLGGFFRFHWFSLPFVLLFAVSYRCYLQNMLAQVWFLSPHFVLISALLVVTYFTLERSP